jgi:L-threonylcarbamoyladenylate synthase
MSTFRSGLARHILWNGGIIAYPTEGVWGLGCLPLNKHGTQRILTLKNRSVSQGMILVAASISQLSGYVQDLEPALLDRLSQTNAEPTTWLIPDNGTAPRWVVGDHDTLAVRVSTHPIIQSICRATGSAIISTSANVSGKEPARTIFEVRQAFGNNIDYLYPGELGSLKNPTRIRELITNKTIRAG